MPFNTLHPLNSDSSTDFVRSNIYKLIIPDNDKKSLEINCNSINLNLLQSTPILIPAITHFISLAGMNDNPGGFEASFYSSLESMTLNEIMQWRRKCTDDEQYMMLGVPSEYRRNLVLAVYDPYGDEILIQYEILRAWPIQISGLQFDVKGNDLLNIQVSFRCDLIKTILKDKQNDVSPDTPYIPGHERGPHNVEENKHKQPINDWLTDGEREENLGFVRDKSKELEERIIIENIFREEHKRLLERTGRTVPTPQETSQKLEGVLTQFNKNRN